MKAVIAIFLLAISSHVLADEVEFSNIPRVETIYGISYLKGVVQIQVESNGCTSKESFIVEKYVDSSDNSIKILFIRNRPDWCRAYLAEGVGVQFSKDDLGLADRNSFTIENPVGPNPRLPSDGVATN